MTAFVRFIGLQLAALVLYWLFTLLGHVAIDVSIQAAWGLTLLPRILIPGVVMFTIPVMFLLHAICVAAWFFSFCALNEPARRVFKCIVILQLVLPIVTILLPLVLLMASVGCWMASWFVLGMQR